MEKSMLELLKAERLCAEKMFDIAMDYYLNGQMSKEDLHEVITNYVKVIDMGLTANETL